MLTISDVSNLVKLETEYNTAVEHRIAAREAVNSADFRFHAMLEVCEHAINLQKKTQGLYRHAEAAYYDAHTAAKKSFHALEEARKSATVGAP